MGMERQDRDPQPATGACRPAGAETPSGGRSGSIERVVSVRLPPRHGAFTIHGFLDHRDGKEHSARRAAGSACSTSCAPAAGIPANTHSDRCPRTKRDRMGYLLDG